MNKSGIYLRYPGGKAKAFTMSFDDARLRDADIIKVFQKYGIKATFFLAHGFFGKSQYLVADSSQAKALYDNTGMEVAGHTINHRDLPTVFEQEGEQGLKLEILDNIATLEELFDCKVYGMSYSGAPPYKLYSDAVIEFLAKNSVGYARTLHAKTPTFELPQNWLLWEPTIWIGNVDEVQALAKQFVDDEKTVEPLLYNIWGHAYDIDDRWESFDAFEQFCENMGSKQGIWYATYGDIYCYATAFEKLQIINNTVINPTDITLWFDCSGKIYEIKPGQTVEI